MPQVTTYDKTAIHQYSQDELAKLNAEAQQALELTAKDVLQTDTKRIPSLNGKPRGKQDYYSYAQLYAYRAINTLVALLDSKHDSIRLGAAGKLLDKTLPDLKAIEVNGEMRQAMTLNVVQFGAQDLLAKHLEAKEQALEATTEPTTTSTDSVPSEQRQAISLETKEESYNPHSATQSSVDTNVLQPHTTPSDDTTPSTVSTKIEAKQTGEE